jgi:predicted transcriptional regulator of viral defense system
MNKIYQKLYPDKVFTLEEARKIIKKYQVCKNTLTRLIKQGLLKRIKKNIYYIVPLDNEEFYPDLIHIGSKMRKDGVLVCNTALAIHGLYPKEQIVFIAAEHAAKTRIQKYTYRILHNLLSIGIEEVEYATQYNNIRVRITDKERSIIDCLRTRSIKIEDLVIALRKNKTELSTSKILKYLEKYNKPILYNKTGLLLELTQSSDSQELDKIRKKLTKKIFYAKERGIRLIKPRYKYYKPWNIMIPESLFDMTKVNVQPQNVQSVS